MNRNGEPSGAGDDRRRAAAIVFIGLPSDCVAIIVLTRGFVQATGVVVLVLVTIVALWSFATQGGD